MAARKPTPPNDELREKLGQNLRECRHRLGISQEALGFRAGLPTSSVGLYELGKKQPMIATFIRLAGGLGATPSELTAGISWTPGVAIVTPGGFEVPDDPELAAEIAALRASAYQRGRRRNHE